MASATALLQYNTGSLPVNGPKPVTKANRPDRIVNYSELNRGYVARGRIDTWVDVGVFDRPVALGGKGRPKDYSEGLVEMLLLLKIKYRLPYRDLEGFASSIFELFNKDGRKAVPSFGTIALRVRGLGRFGEALQRTIRATAETECTGQKCLLIDSTGVSIQGMGPWRATRPWTKGSERKRRQFVKLHIALNPETGLIEAAIETPSNTHDSEVLPDLLRTIGTDDVTGVVTDGAYHTKKVFKHLVDRGIRDIRIPPRKNAGHWDEKYSAGASIHNQALSDCVCLGRKGYKKKVKYHVRSLVESAMWQLHSLTGSRARNKTKTGLKAEILASCIVVNRQTLLARAVYNQRAWKAP